MLPFQATGNMLADLLVIDAQLAGTEQGTRVVLGLEQPGDGQRLELLDDGGLTFLVQEVPEPGRIGTGLLPDRGAEPLEELFSAEQPIASLCEVHPGHPLAVLDGRHQRARIAEPLPALGLAHPSSIPRPSQFHPE